MGDRHNNVIWHHHPVDRSVRADQKHQLPAVIWFTGLSASGKSTLAGVLEQMLTEQGYHTYLLDGDNVRHGLCRDLSFSAEDRQENIRRVGEAAALMADAGLIVLAAFISPFRADRRMVREALPEGAFVEVFVDAPLEVCRERDPKGLYQRAEQGEIRDFTGIDSPYEPPESPEVYIDTSRMSLPEGLNCILNHLHQQGTLKAGYQPAPYSLSL